MMADTSALVALKDLVKQQRKELKQLLKLIELAEGLETAIGLLEDEDEAGDVNIEIAHDGDVLFEVDLDELGELEAIGDARQALLSFLQSAQVLTQTALSEAEQDL